MLDVKNAIVNAPIEEEIYEAQPNVFSVKGKENHAYRLKEALYDLC